MSQYDEISPKVVNEKLKTGEKLAIIDVREEEEYAAGHIPGAKLLSLGQIPTRIAELEKDKEYIVVCRSGNRSGLACEWLAEKGFHVKNMTGGMLEWPGETSK